MVGRAVPRGQTLQILLQRMIVGVEVTLDDDVEVRDLCLTPRVEAEAAVEGVDALIFQFLLERKR